VTVDVRTRPAPPPPDILTRRTLANSHPTLLRLLRPALSVLDVGCGPGTLTREIARLVAPAAVVGMDRSRAMIRTAEAAMTQGGEDNLVFYVGDIRESAWNDEFDVVNAARALAWIPDPGRALARMARAAVPGGRVVVRDDDHTQAEWSGAPEAWLRFVRAFLRWREAGGLDNAMARRLPALAEAAGLEDMALTRHVTAVKAGAADFFRVAGRWRMIVESRGRQVVAAGHLSESERRGALAAYTEWMRGSGAVHTSHEACLVARRP
jgi:SAM-dependent methyltransferase